MGVTERTGPAVSVLTETITELALDALQTSYAKTSRLNTHIRNEKASYSNQTQAGPDKPLCSKVAAMIPLTDLRTLHAEDASILRSARSPNLCVGAVNSKFVTGGDQTTFFTDLYKEKPISTEQQEQLFKSFEDLNNNKRSEHL